MQGIHWAEGDDPESQASTDPVQIVTAAAQDADPAVRQAAEAVLALDTWKPAGAADEDKDDDEDKEDHTEDAAGEGGGGEP